jgi:uncharacterized protein (DUF1800 family)
MKFRQNNLLSAVAFAALASTAVLAHAAAAPMGYDDARHLLARTGFGPTDAEVRTYATLSRGDAVARLLRETRATAVTPPPLFAVETGTIRRPGRDASDEERKAFVQEQARYGLEMRAWWVREMLATPSPLTERMTLFWHNHFVSSQQKVRVARLMYAQNALLRANALGNFGTLLHASAKDPAMLVYLDSAQNRKGQPNENFAREVMELFTLGEGRYSEQDIKEAARAFTGWSLSRDTGDYMFRPALHDYGSKSVLGKSGQLDGDAVLDILLAQQATSEFLTTKLWREFVSPDPDPREVKRIAANFRGSGYDIKVVLRELMLSDAFWARENRGTLVKSPVEFVVGTLRQLEVQPASGLPFALVAAGMGQNLFSPPNVKGWPGGNVWIDTNTLLARKQFVDRLARADESTTTMTSAAATAMNAATMAPSSDMGTSVAVAIPKQALAPSGIAGDEKARAQRLAQQVDRGVRNLHFDANEWLAARSGASPSAKEESARLLLLALPPQAPPSSGDDALAFVRATLQDPVYQLK